jgi:EKC/KEOPS complex subunit CGI121/TPRKB
LKTTNTASANSLTAASIQAHLQENIQGEQIEFSDENLRASVDVARVKKVYKLNAAGGGGGGGKKAGKGKGDANTLNGVHASSLGDERKELEIQVLGIMALRGAT